MGSVILARVYLVDLSIGRYRMDSVHILPMVEGLLLKG